MNDISHKTSTRREAKAEGKVLCSPATLEAIASNQVPKGNVLEFARAAGLFGAKKTDQLLPHCHPVSIDGMSIDFELEADGIRIECTGISVGRTGIEMEALAAVSVAALTVYDMLKPIDKSLEITGIRLLDKKGGKSDKAGYVQNPPKCALLVCSEEICEGTRADNASPVALELLAKYGVHPSQRTIGNKVDDIQAALVDLMRDGAELICTIGGTGLGSMDTTYDAVAGMLDFELDGIVDAMRSHAFARNPLALTSRLLAGSIGRTVVITLPGSQNGTRECLEAILPVVFKVQRMLKAH